MGLVRTLWAHLLVTLVLTGCSLAGGITGRSGVDHHSPGLESAGAATQNEDYRLGMGDVISVRVYGGEEEIRIDKARIDSSGTLTLPFGDFKTTGSTTKELETTITENVRGRLLRNPRVSVLIDEYRPFFVDGQVGRPGAYPYQPGLTVRKAVTIAGGFKERASLDKIFLLRESDKSNRPVRVNLNATVRPGDTINVEESFF